MTMVSFVSLVRLSILKHQIPALFVCHFSNSSPFPDYNYGLSGQGKCKDERSKFQSIPRVKGEILFGIHPVLLALKSQRREQVHGLYIDDKFEKNGQNCQLRSQIVELALSCKAQVHRVKQEVLHELSGNRPHQGVCLDVRNLKTPEWNELESLSWETKLPLWLLLHNIQDPMNFGAILRTAFYFGVEKVVVPFSNSCKLSPVVSKASAGTMEIADIINIPASSSESLFCNWWKHKGGEVIGTGSTSDQRSFSLYNFKMTKPTLLIMGNEGFGLSKELEDISDTILTIPGHSSDIDSLNVSVAAGLSFTTIISNYNPSTTLFSSFLNTYFLLARSRFTSIILPMIPVLSLCQASQWVEKKLNNVNNQRSLGE